MSEPIQTLDQWLQIATERLSPGAKERIALEIQAHFADAVENLVSQGLAQSEAQAQALTDLGDASAAGRRFSRSHLTEADVERIERLVSSYRRWGRYSWMTGLLLAMCLLGCVGFCYAVVSRNSFLGILAIGAIPTGAFQIVCGYVACRHDLVSRVETLLALELLHSPLFVVLVGIAGLACSRTSAPYWYWSVPFLALPAALISIAQTYPLLRKVHRNRDVAKEMPPPTAA